MATEMTEMTEEHVKAILDGWGTDICARGAEVDPDNELDWQSLWMGYAIAKGLSPEYAFRLYTDACTYEA